MIPEIYPRTAAMMTLDCYFGIAATEDMMWDMPFSAGARTAFWNEWNFYHDERSGLTMAAHKSREHICVATDSVTWAEIKFQ